jgi:iron(III) transport system substrate-binding protein
MYGKSFLRRDLLKAAGAFAGGVAFPAALKAATPEPTAVSPALIEAARREDTVAFYTAMEIPLAESLAKAFEAKYPGISVRVKRSGAERVFERIGEEEGVSLYEVDVVCSTDAAHFIHWKRDGQLAPFVPEDAARFLPHDEIDADGMFATVFALLSPIAYNTRLVASQEAPKSFLDLLDPRWKGRIVKARPAYSGTILTATFLLVRALGWSYFEKLAQQNVTQVLSASEPPKRLARGESAVQADGAGADLMLLKEAGAPVEVVHASEGTPLITAPSAVFKSAPHPNAARLFQSFLFSREAQQALVDTYALRSFHAQAKEKPGRTPMPTIKLMKPDPAAMEAQRDEIKARYGRIFGT